MAPFAFVTVLHSVGDIAIETDLPVPSATLTVKTEFGAADHAVKVAVNFVAMADPDAR